MKNGAISVFSAVLLLFYCIAVAVAVLSPLNLCARGRCLDPGGDFVLRVNEIECLLKGVNPFDVWHGDIVLKPYVPNFGEPRKVVEGKDGYTEIINAYAPWEYIVMMPFALMQRTVAWTLYFLLMMAGLGVLFVVGRSFCFSFSKCDRATSLIGGAVPVLLAGLPIYQNFHTGNLAVPVLVAAALLPVCLNRGHDVLAGMCWMFVMLKPQLGLIFVVPLFMCRKFLTCLVAAAMCFALACISALLCHTSPFKLILQTPAANTFAFMGCGTMPSFLCPYLPGGLGIIAGLVVGAALCAYMTRRLVVSGVRDWTVVLMPAAVMGAAWTYAQCYSFSMNWFFFLVLCSSIVKWPRSRFLWVVAALSAVFMTRLYNLAHFLPKVLPGVVPEFLPSEAWHYHIDSVVSGVSIVLTLAFCIWISRRAAKEDMPRPFRNEV